MALNQIEDSLFILFFFAWSIHFCSINLLQFVLPLHKWLSCHSLLFSGHHFRNVIINVPTKMKYLPFFNFLMTKIRKRLKRVAFCEMCQSGFNQFFSLLVLKCSPFLNDIFRKRYCKSFWSRMMWNYILCTIKNHISAVLLFLSFHFASVQSNKYACSKY